jgi:hypothetical protein
MAGELSEAIAVYEIQCGYLAAIELTATDDELMLRLRGSSRRWSRSSARRSRPPRMRRI